jgi:hypothetical protein
MKIKYRVIRTVNYPDKDITYDVVKEDDLGFEHIGEFVYKKDAQLFTNLKNQYLRR